jgi:hypothetical protein
MSKIYNDFLPYRDSFGLNQVLPNSTTQNGTLFTVEYLICLLDNEAPELKTEINRIQKVFLTCEPTFGLSVRYPGSTEYDSMDNSAALLVFSSMFGERTFATRMYFGGVNPACTGIDLTQDPERNKKFYWLAYLMSLGRPKFYWNNQHHDKFCFFGWYGRSPGFMGLLDICAGRDTSYFKLLCLFIGQFLCLFESKDSTSDRKLSYIVWCMLSKRRNRVWLLGYKLWLYVLNKQYPRGMKDVYAKYYQNDSHPIVTYTK